MPDRLTGLTLNLRPDRTSRFALRLIAGAALAGLTAGFLAHPDLPRGLTALLGGLITLGLTRSLTRDTERQATVAYLGEGRWRLTPRPLPDGAAPTSAPPGRLAVRVDLGAWLLLVFEPDDPRAAARSLALSQRDHPRVWHALRAALYSPGSGRSPRSRPEPHRRSLKIHP